jgi:hypothetical protein
MNRYAPSRINPFVGIAAVAMTAATFVIAVAVPSRLAPTGSEATALAAWKPATTRAVEVTVLPAIEVVGLRDATLAERHYKRPG